LQCWYYWCEGFINVADEMDLGAFMYIPSFIKIGSAIQTLIGGRDIKTHRRTHREQGDVISLASACHLSPGIEPWCALDRRLSGPQSRSGRYGKDKHVLPFHEKEPQLLDRPTRSLFGIRLSYPGSHWSISAGKLHF
jgi:hypothetical protein